MLNFIRSAKSELALEHLSLPKVWVDHGSGGATSPSPIVEEILAAARRGVHVRALLNDDSTFGNQNDGSNQAESNIETVNYLKAQAAQAHLPIEAAIFNKDAIEVGYVHNKGMVADGDKVFVSSINGTQNAVMNNREIAVAVNSADAAKYFTEVFNTDWALSAK
jgi:phosphatidylserine/phosphatidylglycerophosphate/cardiolipin synthase-like enzyme